MVLRWQRRGLLLGSVFPLLRSSQQQSPSRGGEEGDDAKVVAVPGEEEDGAAHRLRFHWRPLLQWRAMSETSPASSTSGYAGQCTAVFVSPLRLLGR